MLIGYKRREYIVYVSLKCMYSTFQSLRNTGHFKAVHRNPPAKNEIGIGVVRNPYSRIESFYKDKMIQSMNPELRQTCQKLLAKVFDRQRLVDKKISFQEFVLKGLGKNLIKVSRPDHHLHQQSEFIPNNVRRIIHLEKPEEIKALSNIIGADLTNIKSNNTSKIKINLTWTPEMRRIVNHIYKEDFVRFGYKML